jgi:hypothetical protein
MIVSHQPPTVVNRWRCGVGARVVLELAIVVASCGAFGLTRVRIAYIILYLKIYPRAAMRPAIYVEG